MQLLYLAIALVSGIAELFTGTFYLAAIALAALITLLSSFFLPHLVLHWVFLAAGATLAILTAFLRHSLASGQSGINDLDIGQTVELLQGPDPEGHYRVHYRGSDWSAVLEKATAPVCRGEAAIIVGREGSLLHIAPIPASSPQAQPPCPPSSPS